MISKISASFVACQWSIAPNCRIISGAANVYFFVIVTLSKIGSTLLYIWSGIIFQDNSISLEKNIRIDGLSLPIHEAVVMIYGADDNPWLTSYLREYMISQNMISIGYRRYI